MMISPNPAGDIITLHGDQVGFEIGRDDGVVLCTLCSAPRIRIDERRRDSRVRLRGLCIRVQMACPPCH